MNTISILPESDDESPATFRAFTKDLGATGRTPGEALDALTSQLGAESGGAAVIVQTFSPDKYFSSGQRVRLSSLMGRWRAAREAGDPLPPSEQDDLESLVDEELLGATERAASISQDLEAGRRPSSRRQYRPNRPKVETAWRLSQIYTAVAAVLVICVVSIIGGLFLASTSVVGLGLTAAVMAFILVGLSRLSAVHIEFKRESPPDEKRSPRQLREGRGRGDKLRK